MATGEDIIAKIMEKLELGVNIVYTGVAVWDCTVWVIALVTGVVRCLICVFIAGLLL